MERVHSVIQCGAGRYRTRTVAAQCGESSFASFENCTAIAPTTQIAATYTTGASGFDFIISDTITGVRPPKIAYATLYENEMPRSARRPGSS